jgi:hypothetical protein
MCSQFGEAADARRFYEPVREKDIAMETNMNDFEASVYVWVEKCKSD